MAKTQEYTRQKIITELREQVFELTAQLQRCARERDEWKATALDCDRRSEEWKKRFVDACESAQVKALREALEESARSLEWIAGRQRDPEGESHSDVMQEVRRYASSRAGIARAALASEAASVPLLPKTLNILEFHEGTAKPEHEGAEPTIRVNGEDWATMLAEVRAVAGPAAPEAAGTKEGE